MGHHDTDATGRTLEIGMVTRTDFVRFAGAVGDFNPMHHDDEFARAAGFPSVFAMGMMTASMAARLVTDWFGIAAVRSYDVRFRAMVWPGEQLSVEARIVGMVDQAPEPCLLVTFDVANHAGDVKVSGRAHIATGSAGDRVVQPHSRTWKDNIGEIVREVRFPVEAGKIAEFARAIRDPAPLYTNASAAGDAGFTGIPAPLTFSTAAAHCADGGATDLPLRLGLDLSRTVHGEHHWSYYKIIQAGQMLTGISRIVNADRRPARSGEMVRILVETRFHDEDGDLVVAERMHIIELPERVIGYRHSN
jgi:acyl dehydratase